MLGCLEQAEWLEKALKIGLSEKNSCAILMLNVTMRLTRLEVEALSKSLQGTKVSKIDSDNKREQEEWKTKAAMLGLSVRNIEK